LVTSGGFGGVAAPGGKDPIPPEAANPPKSRERAIGVFDSGLGGLTVVRALKELLPQEHLVYFGDTARAPYGPRPLEEVRRFALEVMDLMVGEDVKMLVIGCNAMTAAAYEEARQRYAVPVVGVIEPGVRAALRATHNGKVAVLGTRATIGSGQYVRALEQRSADVEVYTQVCDGFVELVESGDTFSEELFSLAEDYLAPLVGKGVDTLVLGCTHYPMLKGVLYSVTGGEVELISSADEVAKDTYATLVERGLLRRVRELGTCRFIVSGDAGHFRRVGSRFLPGIRAVEQRPWPAGPAPGPASSASQRKRRTRNDRAGGDH
jgi:glutamate racemase